MIAPRDLPFKRADFANTETLLGLSLDEIRAFSWHNTAKYLRVKLWDRSHICTLCGKEIKDLRSASLDHIVPRSAGGRTRERNVRLAHKKCNSSRNDRAEEYPKHLLEVAFAPMTKNTPKDKQCV